MNDNTIPKNVRKIHLIAVCGTGMGALACMLKELGYEVTGSDQKVYPPMSDFLSDKGIRLSSGYNEKNLSYRPDLVVVGNAVRKDNPEVVKMNDMGLFFCSMPQALNHFAARDKKPILITGTHGKTTTSSIMAWLLYKAGLDPTYMIGGILKNFNSNYRIGKGEHIVIEGDEYDTAFFDKGAKFLHFDPHIAVLTSVEFDHADIFNDLDHVKQTFGKFLSGMSSKSTLLAFDNDPNIAGLIKDRHCRIQNYGKKTDSFWKLDGISIDPPWTGFDVLKNNAPFGSFKAQLMGEHNLLNALSAIAVADNLMVPVDVISEGLETFQNVKRRQEIRGVKNGITVMDDFAHHPTAVRETIRAVKPFCTGGRLIAVFEPRTNSSMRNIFQETYTLSFDKADMVCIRKPPLLEKIPVDERFSAEQLVNDLKHRNANANYFPDTDSIIEFLCREAASGDTVLIMSNGGFDNIHERLLKAL